MHNYVRLFYNTLAGASRNESPDLTFLIFGDGRNSYYREESNTSPAESTKYRFPDNSQEELFTLALPVQKLDVLLLAFLSGDGACPCIVFFPEIVIRSGNIHPA